MSAIIRNDRFQQYYYYYNHIETYVIVLLLFLVLSSAVSFKDEDDHRSPQRPIVCNLNRFVSPLLSTESMYNDSFAQSRLLSYLQFSSTPIYEICPVSIIFSNHSVLIRRSRDFNGYFLILSRSVLFLFLRNSLLLTVVTEGRLLNRIMKQRLVRNDNS